ncbi:MAG: hypothetical protein R2789_04680 [Microthrixaceae bacterium]
MIDRTNSTKRRLIALWWWAATIAILVILDDLTFGPAFWLISRVAGPIWAVVAVYAVYVPHNCFSWPGELSTTLRVASWFSRLDLERRYQKVRDNERLMHSKAVAGATSAVVLSLLIAGVLPPLILWRQGYGREFVLRVAVLTSVVYASEFALIHGYLPSLV